MKPRWCCESTWGSPRSCCTSDIGIPRERELTAAGARLDSMVLKVAHHGSRSSTSSEFLRMVGPRLAAISVGA